ncbi:UNC-like C-terminal-domain-containing protein [Fimicolochytrium jonesii]|uniref:UNC-like C-terminal-domain-containing protein n=1 Tax=Fimicolochytrium jonesii TaxID=1396493 RepID=UPI0022FF27A2|nr:UNC-like C-terminal-domain-containing protein [Fimicolochytrium jonesii]KAI8822192.1 UNC-like C-terminal-domain-containing protein [Fimicolochytrium jonesii]
MISDATNRMTNTTRPSPTPVNLQTPSRSLRARITRVDYSNSGTGKSARRRGTSSRASSVFTDVGEGHEGNEENVNVGSPLPVKTPVTPAFRKAGSTGSNHTAFKLGPADDIFSNIEVSAEDTIIEQPHPLTTLFDGFASILGLLWRMTLLPWKWMYKRRAALKLIVVFLIVSTLFYFLREYQPSRGERHYVRVPVVDTKPSLPLPPTEQDSDQEWEKVRQEYPRLSDGIKRVQGTVEVLETRVQETETRYDGLEKNVQSLETKHDGLKTQHEELITQHEGLATVVADQKRSIENVVDNVQAVERKQAEHNQKLDELRQARDEDQDRMRRELEAAEQKRAELATQVDNHGIKLSSVETNANRLETKIDSVRDAWREELTATEKTMNTKIDHNILYLRDDYTRLALHVSDLAEVVLKVASNPRRHSEDLLPPDYALGSGGGRIIPKLTSMRYSVGFGTPFLDLVGYKRKPGKDPMTLLQPETQPGNCWPMKGSIGQFGIQLIRPIIPTALTIEHAPKESWTSHESISALRHFELYAVYNPSSTFETAAAANATNTDMDANATTPPPRLHLLTAEFNPHVSATTTFAVPGTVVEALRGVLERTGVAVPAVMVKVKGNWGHEEWTCVYRVRVHGEPVGDRGLEKAGEEEGAVGEVVRDGSADVGDGV